MNVNESLIIMTSIVKKILLQIARHFKIRSRYRVIHTDVTQVRLANQQWAYISVMIDEASQEILAFQISTRPNKDLIIQTIKELIDNLLDNAQPIIHSDQIKVGTTS